MATALTCYVAKALATTIATANALVASSGSAGNALTTLVGTATGYGELKQGGSAAAWPALGSIGSPSGFGALYDVTTLEAQTIIAGNWNTSWEGLLSVGSLTADIHQRAYKYNGGVYTLINEFVQSGKNVTTSLATKTSSSASLAALGFVTGDKLYLDTWFNITANASGSGAATVSTSYSQTNGAGNPNYTLVTPGYVPTSTLADEVLTRVKWWFAG